MGCHSNSLSSLTSLTMLTSNTSKSSNAWMAAAAMWLTRKGVWAPMARLALSNPCKYSHPLATRASQGGMRTVLKATRGKIQLASTQAYLGRLPKAVTRLKKLSRNRGRGHMASHPFLTDSRMLLRICQTCTVHCIMATTVVKKKASHLLIELWILTMMICTMTIKIRRM